MLCHGCANPPLVVHVPVRAESDASNKSCYTAGAVWDCSGFFRSICATLELVTAFLPLSQLQMHPLRIQNSATRCESRAKARRLSSRLAARTAVTQGQDSRRQILPDTRNRTPDKTTVDALARRWRRTP